ncbi:hypothetical protein Ccrd_001638 [Cynara cardunculus var. scolymus]|uniref:Serine-threonine/tyrosine-protein kinase catalytic domain-containing protein n=1 Tax=Cynara cardunculus var. scolymus TaxID=59895 RepID=A0A103XSX4_CYNCS|nr:hypothetical protein Ccrd_001638 [Cynara cardunculus var. scolymus]
MRLLMPKLSKTYATISRQRATTTIIVVHNYYYEKSFEQDSHKSNVYSYGMMILEMVGGRKNVEVEVYMSLNSKISCLRNVRNG